MLTVPLRSLIKSLTAVTRAFSTKAKRKNAFDLAEKRITSLADMYIGSDKLAKDIDDILEPIIAQSSCDSIIELCPGPGFFTNRLLERGNRFRKILLLEPLKQFLPELEKLQAAHPEKVHLHCDYISKLLRNGIVRNVSNAFPERAYEEDPSALLFGAVGSEYFFKRVINSILYPNKLFANGRLEMILAVPTSLYIRLTCSSDMGYMHYRYYSVLFQIFFEYQLLAKLPIDEFLPKPKPYKVMKFNKLTKLLSIEPDKMYLIRVVPRREVYELCSRADMPALGHFVKQHLMSRSNRIIPKLEESMPGCGTRLILNRLPSETTAILHQNRDATAHSQPCTTMTNKDYYCKMNIYTQFGDLTPSQILSLFTQFRSWPDYKRSAFMASFEQAILKNESIEDNDLIDEERDVWHTPKDE